MANQVILEAMIEIGGNRWTKGNNDRVYFHGSVIAKLLNLSNSKARQINAAKFYYDVVTSQYKQGDSTTCLGVTDTRFIVGKPIGKPFWVEALESAVEQKMAEMDRQ